MSHMIRKPSLGHVVIYTDETGEPRSARISFADVLTNAGVVGLHVDVRDFMGPVKVLSRVRHSMDGKPGTWRYPAAVEGKIEVPE